MRLKLQLAEIEDAESIAALRNAISDDLTFKHGRGGWTRHHTTAGVLSDLRNAKLYVALHRGEAVASLVLAAKKPWAIELKPFAAAKRPHYLLSLGVAPEWQGQGLGRACLEQAAALAKKLKADTLFLDAYDHAAGVGAFYIRCGYREAGRAVSKDVPLIYYETKL
jgi:GNAT superfamily N-acetyltransferase